VIYLDHNATTPLDPRVLEAMMPYLRGSFGNAASRHHAPGREAAAAVEMARAQVADLIGADPREIVFTSGATEADNLALKGLAASSAYAGRRHIVTVRTEHHAVLDPCEALHGAGFEVERLPVDVEGRIDMGRLEEALRPDTLLVSVMAANNETGVLHPLRAIGHACRARGVLFHTDATQAFGKIPIDVTADAIDLLSFSAHKFHGPKGAGGLYVRRRSPRVRLEPLLHGGGHEGGRRSGTLDVPAIVGLGVAATICRAEGQAEQDRVRRLRDRLQGGLIDALSGVRVNGGLAPRLGGTLNVCIEGLDAESLIARLPDLAISTASACTTAVARPSHVLGAMGLSDPLIQSALRFSLGRFTTQDEIDRTLSLVIDAVLRERTEGPERPSCAL
jgi:cysteine desulfurase